RLSPGRHATIGAARRRAAGRPPAPAHAGRRDRAGTPDRAGRRDRADGGGGQAFLDDPVGATGHRQDQHRAPARRCREHALRSGQCGLRGCGRPEGGLRRGRGDGAHRPPYAAVRGRDPPLQPRPAGRLPAVRGNGHGHAGRRDYGESEFRAQRRAAQPRAS
ncbi:hypothetical protein OY671_011562, partial [Metschnikowia pulcherrima]